MVSTDLGACEWFVWDLRRSNLIERGQLDQVIGEFLSKHPGAEPPSLADYLVGKEVLTQFQAERLLQGKTQGFVLGPFTLMDALGSGSMGTVYKAQSKTDKGCYAVKVLPRRSMWNVRIARRKVRAFDQCKHPAVVPFVDVGTSGGMHYLAWPLVEGESLDKVVQRQGKLTPEQTALFGMQTAEGLAGCHEQALFHGLLKPSNLLVTPDGNIRILDLGIGCLLAETEGESLVDTMSTANSVSSGLDCASPESIMDPTNLTPAGDQYSLGCVLYYCLAGQYPFPDGTAVEKMMAHQTKKPTALSTLNPDVPAEFVAIIERLMQKTPETRFASVQDVANALRPFASATPTPAQPVVRATPTPAQPVVRATPTPARLASRQVPGHDEPRAEVRHASVSTFRDAPPLPDRGSSPPPPRRQGPAVQLPSRQSLQLPPVAPPAAEIPSLPAAPVADEGPKRSLEERFGPIGIAAAALLACVVAWLLSRNLF